VVWVAATDFGEDGVAVERAGLWAGPGFEVVSYAGGSCEAALAEGTGDVGAAVDLAVEMLFGISLRSFSWRFRSKTYSSQVGFALEASAAALAPVLSPVVFLVHVPLGVGKGAEPFVTSLAVILCAVMTFILLVLFKIMFEVVFVIAEFALPGMADSIHVLPCGLPTAEFTVARTTFIVHHESDEIRSGKMERWCGREVIRLGRRF
jgi:hypothetical protein